MSVKSATEVAYRKRGVIQGELKFFPRLQTFITRKLRGIQIYIFFQNVIQLRKFFLQHLIILQHVLLFVLTV